MPQNQTTLGSEGVHWSQQALCYPCVLLWLLLTLTTTSLWLKRGPCLVRNWLFGKPFYWFNTRIWVYLWTRWLPVFSPLDVVRAPPGYISLPWHLSAARPCDIVIWANLPRGLISLSPSFRFTNVLLLPPPACNLKEGVNKALSRLFRFLPGAAPVFYLFIFFLTHPQKFITELNNRQAHERDGEFTPRWHPFHFLKSIPEQLWAAKGFNFRWEIEFCRDMICVRMRSRVLRAVCMLACVSVRVWHKDRVIIVWQEGIKIEKLEKIDPY